MRCVVSRQDDDADEDFEPPPQEDDDDGDETAAQPRNIHARELTDLLEDAYNQVRSLIVIPGRTVLLW